MDAKGNAVPCIDDLKITYQIIGDTTIAGVGKGNGADMPGFQQNHNQVYGGKGLVIVRHKGTPGKIILKAGAGGLKKNGSVEIITE